MKIFKILLSLFFFFNFAYSQNQIKVEPDIIIETSIETYPLIKEWAGEYSKRNPDNEVTVINKKNKNINNNDLMGTISTNLPNNHEYWSIKLCREIIVPVVNKNNPKLSYYKKNGISKKELTQIFSNNIKLNILILKNEIIKEHINSFLNKDIDSYSHKLYSNSEDLLKEIQKDKNGIAFLPLKDIINENKLVDNISFLPIDHNNNGRLDNMENIYESVDQFIRGVEIKKYPYELTYNIYLITKEKPDKNREISFINFLLNKNSFDISKYGLSDLTYAEKQNEMNKIKENIYVDRNDQLFETKGKEYIITILFFLLLIPLWKLLSINIINSENDNLNFNYNSQNPINEKSIDTLDGLFFDKSHTWSFLEKNGKVKIGIDDFIHKVIGPITQIKFKKIGEYVHKGDNIVTIIQKGKQLNLKSPIDGTIYKTNEKLYKNIEILNESPFNGWLYIIKPNNWKQEIPFLKMSQDYKKWIQKEILKLKDFLSYSLNDNYYNQVKLQDGGEIRKYVLKDLNPKIWEDFQEKFLNK